MSFFLVRQNEAQKLLCDADFRSKWRSLFENCAWATVFQDVEYLKIWNEHFRQTHEFILIYETDEKGNLTGLFPLSLNLETGKLSAAGEHHAEYQTWLATEENGSAFIEKALEILKKEFPEKRLQLIFLAPRTPLEWLKGKWSQQSELREMPRPMVNLNGGNTSAESLRKKGNKTRIRQMKRLGELSFVELESAEEFEKIFDEIESFSRLRLSALHNVSLPECEKRKAFHVDLMRKTDVVYPTLLRVGGQIASAQVCFRNRDEMLLSMTSMSPFFAKQSPSKIHLLMLGEKLTETKFENLDLSPGLEYKERFATHVEKTFVLTIFFDKADFLSYKSKRKIAKTTRETLENLQITKTRAFRLADKLRHKLKRVSYARLPQTVLKNIRRKIYEFKECRFYYFEVEKIAELPEENFLRRNSIEDLLKYEPVEGWQFTKSEFHREVLKRLEEGAIPYTFAENGKLLHYGWLLEHQEVSQVYEIGAEFRFPPDTAVLFDFYTHPEARGRGLYKKSLCQLLHAAVEVPGVRQVFIGVMADNKSSRHVIEKLGFRYHSSLFKETLLGNIRK